ncbi:unnamed protein product [Orchesella dallaii]|uniref:Peptidase M12A domain-containing protein n=1 Tax=Orchesella dallaii TaxID=48710 RepID=A0ABP1RXM9_9HEXA
MTLYSNSNHSNLPPSIAVGNEDVKVVGVDVGGEGDGFGMKRRCLRIKTWEDEATSRDGRESNCFKGNLIEAPVWMMTFTSATQAKQETGPHKSEEGNQSEYLVEDDSFMTSNYSLGSGVAATAIAEPIWDFGVIPYEIDANFDDAHRELFKQAMRHLENSTCVKVVERKEEHQNYIFFTEKACGCCSFVGKRGNGPQSIGIGENCELPRSGEIMQA